MNAEKTIRIRRALGQSWVTIECRESPDDPWKQHVKCELDSQNMRTIVLALDAAIMRANQTKG